MGHSYRCADRSIPGRARQLGARALLFSDDGATLFSAGADGKTLAWNVGARQPLHGHEKRVRGVGVSPDGRLLITSSFDGAIVIWWDIANRELLGPPLLTGKETETMALSSDGRSLLLGSFDETATQWRLDSRPWDERACRIANRNLSEDEWVQFMGEKPYREICPDP